MTKCDHCGESLTEEESAALPVYDVDLCTACVAYLLARDDEEKREANARYEREALP